MILPSTTKVRLWGLDNLSVAPENTVSHRYPPGAFSRKPLIVQPTQQIHVKGTTPLIAPCDLLAELPMTEAANQTVVRGRQELIAMLAGTDPRLLVVVGPCSIHDEKAAMEYARRLKKVSDAVQQTMLIIMRVYFEKPRTVMGWKGLINDPWLDGSFDIAAGLRRARKLLLEISEMGMPAATEMLEPITPQYVADLVTWAAIGARTTESQTHRQMASGLSMPVGYKNGTDGNCDIAIQAMQAARNSHSFLGIDTDGRTCIIHTTGNPYGHLILRGGRTGPNYDAQSVKQSEDALIKAGLPPQIMVDCSHANSDKDYSKQAIVWRDAIAQRAAGNHRLFGLMLESHLIEGNQKLSNDLSQLKYGVSITDGCLGWEQTEDLILWAHEQLMKIPGMHS